MGRVCEGTGASEGEGAGTVGHLSKLRYALMLHDGGTAGQPGVDSAPGAGQTPTGTRPVLRPRPTLPPVLAAQLTPVP